jgi:uncharacterized protein YjbI with pentapeptide repeats
LKANLKEANLEGANLVEVNFKEANFKGAILKGSNLTGAALDAVNFEAAFLKETYGLSLDQLSKVKTLYNAIIDDELLIPLKEKRPELFEPPH